MASFAFTQNAEGGRIRGHAKSEFEIRGVGTATGTYGATKVPVTAASLGFSQIVDLRVQNTGTGTFSFVSRWNTGSSAIQLYSQTAANSALVEVGTGTDVGTHLFNIVAVGR